MYGAHYSKATVSNMTKAVNEQVQAFQQRRLASQYAANFLDATYLPLKRDTVQKEAVHIAIGIRPDGTKEVLNYQVAPTESTGIWTELLGTLIKQGVKDVVLFVADGLVGLDECQSQYERLLFERYPALTASKWHLRRWPHIVKPVDVAGKLEPVH